MRNGSTPGPQPWGQLAALCLVPFTMVLGNAMLMPVLPQMGEQLGLSGSAAGLAVTAFSLTAGLGILLAGYLADRYGRKPVVLPGLLLFATGAAAAALSGWLLGEAGFPALVGARVVQGLGAAGMAYMAMAFVGDLFDGGARVTALGLLEAAAGLGKLLSPIGGAVAGSVLAWWSIFVIQATVALSAALAVWLLTREPPREKEVQSQGYFGSLVRVIQQKGISLGACLWTGLINQFVLFGVLFFLTQHLENEHGIHGLAKGLYLLWPLLALSLCAFVAGLVLDRRKGWLKGAVLAGVTTVLIGTGVMALIPAGWASLLGAVLVGIGTGLQLPGLNDLVTGTVAAAQRGGITAAYGAVRFLGTALGPPLFGWFMSVGELLPFGVAGGLLALTGAVILLLIDPKKLRSPGGGGPEGRSPEPWQVPTGLPSGTRGNL
ncbi:MAG: MFS transporter [Bacillota bacterium]